MTCTSAHASAFLAILVLTAIASAASKDLGNGFRDHGVAAPISNHRGTVAAVDAEGNDVLLMWLMDHRGGYELLMLDAQTGKAQQFPMPFELPEFDAPYASLLSSANKFYTAFRDHFVEFDPAKPGFTFSAKTNPQMAMGMTEDDNGKIWAVLYPQSVVVSFDPKTRAFKDYGEVYKQNWQQYQRYVAADDTGWIYFGLGNTASQIVALDPETGKAQPMLDESEREKGSAFVYRATDGKVYGRAAEGDAGWSQFYKGKRTKLDKKPTAATKPFITSSQALFKGDWADGKKVKTCDLVERKLVIQNKDGSTKEFSFNYDSDGAIVMSVATAANGTASGGTAFPMRCFQYDPKKDEMTDRAAYGQWNTVAPAGDHFFVGGYPGGFLLDWQPNQPWVPTDKKTPNSSNPQLLTACSPEIHRPHRTLPLADGKIVVMAGTPDYGYTGGGLLFWNRQEKSRVLLNDRQIIPDQSTFALVELPDAKLLGGTTTAPGTGGEKKAKEAQMYLIDAASKKIDWHAAVFPGAQEYTDLCAAPNNLIYGFADRKIFFVFDPVTRKVVHQHDIDPELGMTSSQQGPRVFVKGPKGETYLVLAKGIGIVEPDSRKVKMVAKSRLAIEAGGDYLDGRIYFVSGSHVCSYQLDGK